MVARLLLATFLALLAGAAGPGTPPSCAGYTDASACPVTPAGGSVARTMAARAADVMNALDRGVKADARYVYGGISATAGSTSLTCSGCAFTAADVGHPIVVWSAGTPSATGGVTSIPVTAAGSGYATQPSVVLSGTGSGQGAAVYPEMQLASVAISAAGTGAYTPSTTFPLTLSTASGGNCASPPVVNVTTNGSGTPTGVSIASAGSCTIVPGSSGVAVVFNATYLGFGLTLNVTWSVLQIDVLSSGWGYPLSGVTAALSAGNAALGTPVVSAYTPPLATSIATVISGTQVLLAAPAGATAGGSQTVILGTDNNAALTAALVSACAAGKELYLPGGNYGVVGSVTIPPGTFPNNCQIRIRGAGRGVTAIYQLGAGSPDPSGATSLFYRGGGLVGDDTLSDITLDGNELPSSVLTIQQAHGFTIQNARIRNAAPGGNGTVIVGNPTSYVYSSGFAIRDSVVENMPPVVTAQALPNYALAIYSPDNEIDSNDAFVNARLAYLNISGNTTRVESVHPWGQFGAAAQYALYLGGQTIASGVYLDSPSVAGAFVSAAAAPSALLAPYCVDGGVWPGIACVQIASGAAQIDVRDVRIGTPSLPAAADVVQLGTADPSTIVAGGRPGSYTTGLNGYTTGGSLAVNAHDGSTNGGDALGAGAVDLQLPGFRNYHAQSATGGISLNGGTFSTAAGYGSIAWGYKDNAGGAYSFATGTSATDHNATGLFCRAVGLFSQTGDQQGCFLVQSQSTASTAQVELGPAGDNTDFGGHYPLQVSGSVVISAILTGYCAGGGTAAWQSAALATRPSSGSASIVGSPSWTSLGATTALGTPAWGIDATYHAPVILITPAAATACHWVAHLMTADVQ